MKSIYAHITNINSAKGNLGDKMGFLIADHFLGIGRYKKLGIRQLPKVDRNTVGMVGSLVGAMSKTTATILGGGLINSSPRKYSSELNILGVRGYLTKTLIMRDAGISVPVISDPGLLLSVIKKRTPPVKRKKLGFIVHHVDRDEFIKRFPYWSSDIVDNYEDPDFFVKNLLEYDCIASTSLHGIVFSHSYGLLCAPFVLTDDVIGGDFKFQDYYSSLGIDIKGRLELKGNEKDVLELVQEFSQPSLGLVVSWQESQMKLIRDTLAAPSTNIFSLSVADPVNEFKPDVLVVTEILFCDNESSKNNLDRYFAFLKENISSFFEVEIRPEFRNIVLVYISSDKSSYIDELQHFLNLHPSIRRKNDIRIVVYTHPEGGYKTSEFAHVDDRVNPNKSYGRRDALFALSKLDKEINSYKYVIRTAIDDDDIAPSWHINNICDLALKYVRESKRPVAICMLNTCIVYLKESGNCDLNLVRMNRSINGNKFIVFPSGVDCSKSSPWMVPDVVDVAAVSYFDKKLNSDLYYVDNKLPGVFYMRRGGNLSSFNKGFFVDRVYENLDALSVTSLSNWVGIVQDSFDQKVLIVPEFKVRAFIDPDKKTIFFKANLHDINKVGCCVAFYLYSGKTLLVKTLYSKVYEGIFNVENLSIDYRIKGFLKNRNGDIETFSTPKIVSRR